MIDTKLDQKNEVPSPTCLDTARKGVDKIIKLRAKEVLAEDEAFHDLLDKEKRLRSEAHNVRINVFRKRQKTTRLKKAFAEASDQLIEWLEKDKVVSVQLEKLESLLRMRRDAAERRAFASVVELHVDGDKDPAESQFRKELP